MRARCLLAAIGFCLLTVAPAAAQDSAAELAAALDRFRDRYGFTGATAAIALPGDRLVTAARGVRSGKTTRLWAYSVEKLALDRGALR